MTCENKVISIYKGFGTKWNNEDLLTVSFDSELDLTGFCAEFIIGNIVKTYQDISNGFVINLTAQETGTLPLGQNSGTLVIVDKENHKKPFSTELPFLVKDWEGGDIKLDGFKLNINAKIQENDLFIKIETADSGIVIERYVREQIELHNTNELAHPYIQGLVSDEATAREEAVSILQEQINTISTIAYGYVHEQGVASAVWTVQHNLNKYPSVTVVDSAENEIVSEVEYLDKNTVKITMTGSSKGRAYLN